MKKKITDIFNSVLDIYVVSLVFLFSVEYFVPIVNLMGSIDAFCWTVTGAVGAVLLVATVFIRPKLLLSVQNVLLIAFAGAMFLSAIVNYKYALLSNIKEICWMCIMFFLIQSVDSFRSKEKNLRLFKIITNMFVVIWFVGVFVSFCQFIVGYGDVVPTPNIGKGEVHSIGFMNGRLFGVFVDPNFAAMGAFMAIIFAVLYLVDKKTKKTAKIFYVITVVFEVLYIILSASRTAAISVTVGICFLMFFLVRKAKFSQKYRPAMRETVSVIAALVFSVVLVFGGLLMREGLAYVPGFFSYITTDHNVNDDVDDSAKHTTEKTVVDSDEDGSEPVDGNSEPHGEHISPADMHRQDVGTGNISNNRFKIWKDAIDIWKTTPIVGASPRGYLEYASDKLGDMYIVQKKYAVHNTYISVLLFTGILGTLFAVAWFAFVVYKLLRYLFSKKVESSGAYMRVLLLSAILVAEAVSALALSKMFFTHLVTDTLLWFIVGYILYYISLTENDTTNGVFIEPSGVDKCIERFKSVFKKNRGNSDTVRSDAE